jgi:hypothetical protein
VVNAAVDLNGYPSIDVIAKWSAGRELILRSVDLGLEERVGSYDELAVFDRAGDGLVLAKAALILLGFGPRSEGDRGCDSLGARLNELGGGIELTLRSAVPLGTGLGSSSILAATIFATLSALCGLAWTREDLIARTLALEQMVTSGGGWQDPSGGLFPGFRLRLYRRRQTPGRRRRRLPFHVGQGPRRGQKASPNPCRAAAEQASRLRRFSVVQSRS